MINFDQASSSFPKAPNLPEAVAEFIRTGASNINRGSLNISYEASQLVYKTREYLLDYFGAKNKQVVFTKNVTESLNLILKGYLKNGDHIIISGLEHNAVMRPLKALEKSNISYSIIPSDEQGSINADCIPALIKPDTKAILTTAASNVAGNILPLRQIGKVARLNHIPYFVDAAQLAGFLPLNMDVLGIDLLAITGHKSLLGPHGIGAVILSDEIGKKIEPLIYGGTGSVSDKFDMPESLPDKFEAGTQNLIGIAGLLASMRWLKENHIQVLKNEIALTNRFITGINELSLKYPIKLIGLNLEQSGYLIDIEEVECGLNFENLKKNYHLLEDRELLIEKIHRTPVVSVYSDEIDIASLSFYLESEGKIATRVGMQCSPLAHTSLKTFPKGTLRFSFGYNETIKDVDYCLKLIKEFFSEE
ncbi:hypothetical protein HMPREF9333_00780 [Johnsonella ignava ATCC 51276]|uniref:Aminotransferase class V domain-containing protein n=1 Tax=Johnsonella ignava ATCC 51276 TaxID=679200 RepID=G5GGU0_9FIRM|nr:aminotransferase class V-fold PLP-dependent enzyme [Johnsonella ignava]EHI55998.1 hypothetical protein HMPREF9333_00780 [Johnsonella ignava ATCC 51276]